MNLDFVLFFGFGVGVGWVFKSLGDAYIEAQGWNMGYQRGIEQGLREAAEAVGGPPAPLRMESYPR